MDVQLSLFLREHYYICVERERESLIEKEIIARLSAARVRYTRNGLILEIKLPAGRFRC